jgi:hypothetical protein
MELIFRGSRDGMYSKNFHEKCDNQSPTITLFRNDKGNIFGGYLPIPWKSEGGYQNVNNAFIFTLTNIYNIQPTKFASRNYGQEIYFGTGNGPCFYDTWNYDDFVNNSEAYFGDHYADVPDAENWHKWTIKDAKVGDVLASAAYIAIFKEIDDKNFYCFSSCSLINNNFYANDKEPFNSACFAPATKEQRDTLFAKMKEAGYEWNIENKELKKIEQKPAWSEEDERKLLEIKCLIGNYRTGNDEYELCSWIDKIKDRVQPQPKYAEWSEYDEKEVAVLEAYIRSKDWSERHIDRALSIVDELVNKVKSLRHQNRWKPSEGQLECLGYAIEKAEKDWSPLTNNRIYLTLKALKEQLLELKRSKV